MFSMSSILVIVLTFVGIMFVISLAAVGLMMGKKKGLSSSCGGLDAAGIEKSCSCKNSCAFDEKQHQKPLDK